MRVLRCRLSLKENQKDFAARFRAAGITISRWERGDVETIHGIYRDILDDLEQKLDDEGLLVPKEAVDIVYKYAIMRRGDAEHPYKERPKPLFQVIKERQARFEFMEHGKDELPNN